MKLVIEIPDDFPDDDALKIYLRHMQEESDDYGKESPEDYPDGYGSLDLSTTHMQVSARIVGILHEVMTPIGGYRIEPVKEDG